MSIRLPGVPVYSIDVLGNVAKFLALPLQVGLDVHSYALHVIPDAGGHLQVPVLPDQPLLRIPCLHILDACPHYGPLGSGTFPDSLLPMLPSEFL